MTQEEQICKKKCLTSSFTEKLHEIVHIQ